ncbi:MAG: inorganic phosphate transporter [Chitinophagales bacterium]|nr:inorganic phosphate transporter [Chitinophagales bacterium]
MSIVTILVIITIVLVVVFDFTNGFHDASNIIATVIASRAMSPAKSVIIVAFFHFIGPLIGGTAVANTIGHFVSIGDLQNIHSVSIILSGLIAVIIWNIGTWWLGMPSSSSHALMGALVGVVMASVGSNHVVWGYKEWMHDNQISGVLKVLIGLMISPLLGFAIGYIIQKLVSLKMRSAKRNVNKNFKTAQYFTVAALSFSHGANDAQKSMGVLTLVLLLGGFIPAFIVPYWVILICASAMTLGVLLGGWKIVRTLGFSIFKIRPIHALNSQLTSALVIFGASFLGAPVSTTHVVTSSIMGVGAADKIKRVKWSKAQSILYTWIFTIPGAAMLAVFIYSLMHLFIPELK